MVLKDIVKDKALDKRGISVLYIRQTQFRSGILPGQVKTRRKP